MASNDKGKTHEEMLHELRSGSYKSLANTEGAELASLDPEQAIEVVKAETIDYDLEGPDLCYRQFFMGRTRYDTFNRVWYLWSGTYWHQIEEQVIVNVIHDFAESYIINGKKKTLPLNNVKFFNEALSFLKSKCGTNHDDFNPHGFTNHTNGVLEITFDGDKVVPILHDHSPLFMMTQRPLFAYDPQAPTEDCDRFLTLLDEKDRDFLMKIAGTALHPKEIAKRAHRVPFAILHGLGGANGKDAFVRMVQDAIGEETTANISIADWAAYEKGEGRGRFNVAQIAGAKLCCDSETTRYKQIDKLEALKKACTHNSLYVEDKNTKGFLTRPYAVFLYNANHLPQVDSLEGAITSRFVVIEFNRQYSTRPSDWEKGYSEADPLFAEDSEDKFEKVLPAFLNRMIDGLQQALLNSYDSSYALHRLETMRNTTNHLSRFAEDIGMTVDINSEELIEMKDIAMQLALWYLDNDYAELNGVTEGALWKTKDPLTHMAFNAEVDLPHDKVIKSLVQLGRRLPALRSDIKLVKTPKARRSAVRALSFAKPFEQQAQSQKTPDKSLEKFSDAEVAEEAERRRTRWD